MTAHTDFEQAKPIAPTPVVAVPSMAIFKGDGVVFGTGCGARQNRSRFPLVRVETKERDLFRRTRSGLRW